MYIFSVEPFVAIYNRLGAVTTKWTNPKIMPVNLKQIIVLRNPTLDHPLILCTILKLISSTSH